MENNNNLITEIITYTELKYNNGNSYDVNNYINKINVIKYNQIR